MPVRETDMLNPTGLMDDLYSVMQSSSVIDVDLLYPNTEPLLSDDIWKKFGLDFPELSGFDDIFKQIDVTRTESSLLSFLELSDCEIRNHDCMWAGHCGSKEHPADEPRMHMNCGMSSAPGLLTAPVPVKQENNRHPTSCQQSLLKPTVRVSASINSMMPPTIHTLQTPPMSDDEEVKSKPTKVLQILNDAISECDIEDDSDLCDYFKDSEDLDADVTDAEIKEEPEDVKPNIKSYQFAAESDHSYHKDKNASMRIANLGIDTPSDSEEEIDVVSVAGDKLTLNRIVCSLPTNPSSRDRHQIQRRMATAISKNRLSDSIKTILPIRKITSPEASPVKRKIPESRGVKRPRQYRMAPSISPFKRRGTYGNSSDSEPEPSEKRSLHNNMERQRRIDLRNAFEDLRVLVPEVSKKERAAKVVILREAAQYCDFLGNVSHNYTRHLEELRKQQERLRGRVSQLRRSLAAKR